MNNFIHTIFFSVIGYMLVAQSDSLQLEKSPIFSGCGHLANDITAQRKCSDEYLHKFIETHLKYPEAAVVQKLEGTVVVSFLIDETGKAQQETVLRDIGLGCGAAALQVIRDMPRWEPAIKNGEKIKTKLTLPIRFALKSVQVTAASKYTIHWGTLRGDRTTKSQLIASLEEPFFVRDELGNTMKVTEWHFILEKKRKTYKSKLVTNQADRKLKKMIRRAGPGTNLTISAVIQEGGSFNVLEKSFKI